MLRPSAVPQLPDKNRVFAAAVGGRRTAGARPSRPAVVWGEDPGWPETAINAVGVAQSTSTFRRDAFVGCKDGSKTTLDLTYILLALHHSAALRPLCEVLAVGAGQAGYRVRYRDYRRGEERRAAALGHRFSPNGDFVTLLWKTAQLRDSSHGPVVASLSRISEGGSDHHTLGEMRLPPRSSRSQGFCAGGCSARRSCSVWGKDAPTGPVGFDCTGLTTSLGRSLNAARYDAIEATITRVARHYQPARQIANLLSGRGPEGLFTVHLLSGRTIGGVSRRGSQPTAVRSSATRGSSSPMARATCRRLASPRA